MKNELANTDKQYKGLVSHISEIYVKGREKAIIAVNTHLVDTYWKIGQYIVEFEQKGKERAEYGTALLKELSTDLKLKHGKGFSLSNIKRMRQFYITFPKGAELPHLLTWTHLLVQYAMHNISSQLFVNKYQLYLPNKEELKNAIETQLNKDDNE